jgi:hypothetical protein
VGVGGADVGVAVAGAVVGVGGTGVGVAAAVVAVAVAVRVAAALALALGLAEPGDALALVSAVVVAVSSAVSCSESLSPPHALSPTTRAPNRNAAKSRFIRNQYAAATATGCPCRLRRVFWPVRGGALALTGDAAESDSRRRRSPQTMPRALIFLALAALAAFAFAACSDDAGESGEGDLIAAITFLDGAGFHGIDESINEEGEVPGDAASVARKAETVVHLTAWPDDLAEDAETLEGIFAALAESLEAESPDLEAAGQNAASAHDGLHDFSGRVWAHLHGEAGVELADDGHAE